MAILEAIIEIDNELGTNDFYKPWKNISQTVLS